MSFIRKMLKESIGEHCTFILKTGGELSGYVLSVRGSGVVYNHGGYESTLRISEILDIA